jgi:hypothetical protein
MFAVIQTFNKEIRIMDFAAFKAQVDEFRANVSNLLLQSNETAPDDLLAFCLAVIQLIDEGLADNSTPITAGASYLLLMKVALEEIGSNTPQGKELSLYAHLGDVIPHTPR